MGLADRDYQRQAPPGRGAFSQLTPVVKWLLIANLGIYFLDMLLKGSDPNVLNGPLRTFGAFTVQSAVHEGRIWEFLTFQFLHGSVGHVLFNCIALFFFGPFMERWWGAGKFLIFYLLCGIAGGAFFTLLTVLHLLPEIWLPISQLPQLLPSQIAGVEMRDGLFLYPQPIVGASAGIYGILVGVAVVAPNLRVALLLPPIELSMRQLAIALLVFAVAVVVLKIGDNEGGQAGHLGGAILGFFLVRFPWLLGGRNSVEILAPPVVRPPAREAKIRPRSDAKKSQDSRVDEILDKISREGFQSLTQEERDFLQEASKPK